MSTKQHQSLNFKHWVLYLFMDKRKDQDDNQKYQFDSVKKFTAQPDSEGIKRIKSCSNKVKRYFNARRLFFIPKPLLTCAADDYLFSLTYYNNLLCHLNFTT